MGRTMNLKSAIGSAEKILEQPTRCEEFAEFVPWRMLRFRFQELLQVAAGKAEAAAAAARDVANLQPQLKGSSTRSPKTLRP